jgi:hypothetical protein
MTTGTRTQYEINGVIDTAQNVLENISTIATASGCFVTWDPDEGKWSIIVNETGASIKSFDDSNIIGPIAISSSGVNELYNSATIEFPHKDIRDSVDIIDITIASGDRYPQELDNNLNIKLDCINDPVQAQLIATRELKQSRVDKVVRFTTDYTSNGLKAGDLIDITASMYSFSSKVFRVTAIEEEDTDEGAIVFSITALEYDANVYSTAGLTYETRNKRTGIIPKAANQAVAKSEDIDAGSQMARLLGANLLLGLLNGSSNPLGGLLKNIFGIDKNTGQISSRGEFNDPDKQAAVSSIAKPTVTVSKDKDNACNGDTVTFSIAHACESCFFTNPQFEYTYTITGVTASEVSIPLTGKMTTTGTSAATKAAVFTITGTSTKTATFTVGSSSQSVTIHPAMPAQYVSNVSASPSSITEGSPTTVTVATVGYANGTTLAYTISGSASSKVTSPALTGNVTINSNSATINITTSDDSVYNNAQSLTITVGTAVSNPCAVTSNTTTVTVNNNATSGPKPPSENNDNDVFCDYVLVPVVWCGRFDENTQRLKSMTVRKSAYLPRASTGGTAVPLTVSVTSPGTASAAISVTSTVNIASGGGGVNFDVITSFSTPPSGGDTHITGTTASFKGYF